jgi:hypothetical protein
MVTASLGEDGFGESMKVSDIPRRTLRANFFQRA